MKIDAKTLKKGKLDKEINKINEFIKTIEKTNKTIDNVTETIMLCGNEIIDKKNFSIMSLPSAKEVFQGLE